MSCQISSGDFEINTSQASWMVAHMCSEWFDQERDTDSDGTYQNQVSSDAIQKSDAKWPKDERAVYTQYLLEFFDNYKRARSVWKDLVAFERDFKKDLMTARIFIMNVAPTGQDAHLSH